MAWDTNVYCRKMQLFGLVGHSLVKNSVKNIDICTSREEWINLLYILKACRCFAFHIMVMPNIPFTSWSN